MCPVTPSSNPNFENRRNEAARRSLRCRRSSARLENCGGPAKFPPRTAEAAIKPPVAPASLPASCDRRKKKSKPNRDRKKNEVTKVLRQPAYPSNPPPATDETNVPQPPAAHSTAPPNKPANSTRAAPPRKYPHPLPARDG